MAMTGSIGITRPMKKVTARSPSRVAATMRKKRPIVKRAGRRSAEPPRSRVAIAAEAISPSVLPRLREAVCLEGRAKDEALDILAQRYRIDLLEQDHVRTRLHDRALKLVVHRGALLGVALEDRGAGLLRQGAGIPGIA